MLNVEQLLKDLTEPQREAATHVDGPLLIVAGAGSGKTRVITRRVAYLVAQGIPASSILAITFTNKAAGEMKERVQHVIGRPIRDFGRLEQPWPMICTFHSLCLRILRHYATELGLPSNFSIYDASDQTKLLKEAMKTLDISSTNFAPGTVHGAISNAKNQLLSPQQYADNARDFYGRTVARIYKKYQEMLAKNNAMDFDDLLLRTADAFRAHPQMLAELQERFAYVLIDEYQDTNHAQYIIAHVLAQKHRNICVVGDPDQSIYAWRGADIKNILEFERDYPDAKVVRLEQNYRSTKTILAIADQLISRNIQRKKKGLWTDNDQGPLAELYLCQDEHDEADVIRRRLRDLHDKEGIAWNQMAIFYRMNSLSRVMEESLFKNKVPYQIARGVEFYNRKEIKDVLAYMRVIANPNDEVSLDRIVNVPPRGLGDSGLKLITAYAIGQGIPIFDAMSQAAQIPGITTRAANGARQFVDLVRRWRSFLPVRATLLAGGEGRADGENEAHPGGPPVESDGSTRDSEAHSEHPLLPLTPALSAKRERKQQPRKGEKESRRGIRQLMELVLRTSGYESVLEKLDKGKEEGERSTDNVNELVSTAAEFDADNPDGTLDEYLANISLVSDADHMAGQGGAVTLMTLHAAKGLEFPVVAMIGLEDGILPHSRARDSLVELEEERRLCFVGITRAQKRLILSKAQVRTVRGLRDRTITSPFLNELPQECLKITDRTGLTDYDEMDRRTEQREQARERSSGLASQFRRGQMVRHPTFGIGRIAEVTDMGQQTRAVVQFNAAGKKTLILQYARLELVG